MNKQIHDFEARARIKAEQPKLIVVCAFCYDALRYRGVSTTAIADGEHVKDLLLDDETIKLLELDGNILTADKQTDGDVFIYDNGTECLEVVVYDGKYGVVNISEMWADLMEDRSPEEKELAEESCSEVRGLLDGPHPDSPRRYNELLLHIKKIEDRMNAMQVAVENSNKKFGEIDSKINEVQTATSLAVRIGKHTNGEVERLKQCMVEFPTAIAGVKAAATGAKVAAEDARAEAAKAAKRPTTVVNAQPGSTVNVEKTPRTDKGGTHTPTPRGWKQQADMVEDFSKSAKKIRGKIYGKMTLEKVKDWEKRYPDETRREPKSDYHAKLRNTPNPSAEIKNDYWASAANWNDYWRKHNNAFTTWLKDNPNGDHALFRKTWERSGKIVHMSDTDKTMRYGTNTFNIDSLDDDDIDA